MPTPNLTLLLALLALPEDAPRDSPPEDDAPPVFHLRDGGKVTGEPRLDTLTVETRYGVLRVPVSDLSLVRFARRTDDDERKAIEREIERLDSEDFDVREDAMEALRRAGASARPLLRRALKTGSDEAKNRAELLLAEIRDEPREAGAEEDGLEPLARDDEDEVATHRFTVRGRVAEERFEVACRYGDLILEAKDLTGVVFHFQAKARGAFEVPATSTVPDSWHNTRLNLRSGQRITLTARGEVTVHNYNLTSGPEGTTRYSGSTFQSFPMLSLVGKIGRNGKPFLVGRELRAKASREGTLYLGVVPFRRGYAATGSYQVKVEPGK
ncbi:MAG: hypothetical protein HY721_08695 [Planctomycetes bacterium]|nr:hypothetical protein [Planctomycetota bacterium]